MREIRNVEIKELRAKGKKAKVIFNLSIICFILISVLLFFVIKDNEYAQKQVIKGYVVLVMILFLIGLISKCVSNSCTKQIELKKQNIELNFIKRKAATQSNLKELLKIKGPDIRKTIISKGIDKFIVSRCVVDQWIVNIYLKDGSYISTQIPVEGFINLLKDKDIDTLLDSLVKSIEVDTKKKDGKTNLKVTTVNQKSDINVKDILDDDLLELIEVKNKIPT